MAEKRYRSIHVQDGTGVRAAIIGARDLRNGDLMMGSRDPKTPDLTAKVSGVRMEGRFLLYTLACKVDGVNETVENRRVDLRANPKAVFIIRIDQN